MGYNSGNILKVKIIKATVYEKVWNKTYYVYEDVRVLFQDSFEFVLPELHELLFNEVAVLFYSDKKKLLGLVKIKLKEFLMDGFKCMQQKQMYDKSYIHKTDFYDVGFKSVGTAELEFGVKKNTLLTKKKKQEPSILNVLIPQGQLEMYKIAFRIFTTTNRGSFFCKVYWFLGFIYATYYYTYCFDKCECIAGSKKEIIKNDNECQKKSKGCKYCTDNCIENNKHSSDSSRDNIDTLQGYMESFKDSCQIIRDHMKDNNNITNIECINNTYNCTYNDSIDRINNIISIPNFLDSNNYINATTKKADCNFEKQKLSDRCDRSFCFKSYSVGDREEIEEAIQCLQYAAASFGDAIITWNLDKVRNMVHVKNRRMRAILERLDGIEEEDVLVDYPGERANLGFVAFIKNDELVISFRGTVSVDDMILDLNCEYTEFQDGYTHRGIKYMVDAWIAEYWSGLEQRMIVHGIKRVLLTGYSLGGAASVLTYLRLQEMGVEKRYVLKSITFGNPPVFSENIAKRDLPHVKIFVYESDFISRLSYGSVQDAKYMCISLSSMCDYFASKENILDNMNIIRHYLFSKNINTKLYHAGVLVHVKHFSNSVLYKRVDYKFFEEMILSRNSPFDHILHRLLGAFKAGLENIE